MLKISEFYPAIVRSKFGGKIHKIKFIADIDKLTNGLMDKLRYSFTP